MAKSNSVPKPEKKPVEVPAPEIPVSEKVASVSPAELNAVVELPAPNERTIAAMAEDANPSANPAPTSAPSNSTPSATPTPSTDPKPGDLDKSGNAFNPEIHDAYLNRDGKWAGKRGRRKGQTSAPKPETPKSVVGSASPDNAEPGSPVTAPIGDRFDLAAELYTRAGYSVLDGVFSGDGEWLPEKDGEHVALRGAVATYLRHKGCDDLPPGLAVSLALATYGAKRISKPNTATRIRLYAQWFRAKWYAWRTGRQLDQLPRAEIKKEEKSPLPPQNNLPGDSSREFHVGA